MVRAAGGVISRRDERGEIEVLLVYRAGGQRDWSFPKGKVEPGETDEACALREVWEETNLRCALGGELPPVSYHDRRGRSKVVRYWAMTAVKGEAEPRNEIAAVRWLGDRGGAEPPHLRTRPRAARRLRRPALADRDLT